MARCPAMSKGDPVKTFKVTAGFRMGNPNPGLNGDTRKVIEGGQSVALTEAQARYFLKMGAIQLELDFGDAQPTAKPDDGDPAKTGSGAEAKGPGADAAGSASGSDPVSETGEGKVGGRKGSL